MGRWTSVSLPRRGNPAYRRGVNLELPADRIAVKICGVTNRADALAAIGAGADLLGFNTWRGSKRFVDLAANADWIGALPRGVTRVALLVNAPESQVESIAGMECVDALQFHGDEDAAFCKWAAALGRPIIKAIRAREAADFATAGSFATRHILLDAHVPGEFGGTGTRLDVALARQFQIAHPDLLLWLAGGLSPENVGDVLGTVRPAVVDVSSGVESSPGRKDAAKMRALVAAVRGR